MSEKVVEPSEIFIDKGGSIREDTVHANPWVRFLARFFDYSLFFLLLWALRMATHGVLPFGKYERLIPFEYFVWIPIEALLLTTLGTTPGKWFLKTKIRFAGKGKILYGNALMRSFHVWFRGLGLGIPFLNFFCLLIAYQRLRLLNKTSWDRDDHFVVTHAPMGRWRIFIAIFVVASGMLFSAYEKKKEAGQFRTVSIRVEERGIRI